ncbi:MAG: toprim domain-containing protein [Herminiimonas sp.]|nr:toprim domain-containing protein [Herminiimonas sp.]
MDGRCRGLGTRGSKVLLRSGATGAARRIAVTESAIDALSLAALEDWEDETVYLSTGGGFGPLTANAIRVLLSPATRLVAATDQGAGGKLLADRLHGIALAAGVSFVRLRPLAKDWNAQLTG